MPVPTLAPSPTKQHTHMHCNPTNQPGPIQKAFDMPCTITSIHFPSPKQHTTTTAYQTVLPPEVAHNNGSIEGTLGGPLAGRSAAGTVPGARPGCQCAASSGRWSTGRGRPKRGSPPVGVAPQSKGYLPPKTILYIFKQRGTSHRRHETLPNKGAPTIQLTAANAWCA
jgi:hypothetical protein